MSGEVPRSEAFLRRRRRPDELDKDLRALVDQRVGLLPLGGDASLPGRLSEDEAASIADAFIEWPHRQDPLDADRFSETIISFAATATTVTDRGHWLNPPAWVVVLLDFGLSWRSHNS